MKAIGGDVEDAGPRKRENAASALDLLLGHESWNEAPEPRPAAVCRPSITVLERLGEANEIRVTRSSGDATSALAVLSIEKGDVAATVPELKDHLLAVTLAGHQQGTIRAEGQVNGPYVSNRPGSLCFVPREHVVVVDVHGSSRHVDVLIGRQMMERAAGELLRGDPARLELAGFNSLLDPVIERLALRVAARMYLHPHGSELFDETLVQALCVEMVNGYARAPRRRMTKQLPRLVGLRLMAVLDLLENGSSEDRRLEALARAGGLPPIAFVDAFEVETGMTLHAYLAEQRIDRLREQLGSMEANELLDLNELAVRLDYSGPSALERACVAAFGLTPEAYRIARGRC